MVLLEHPGCWEMLWMFIQNVPIARTRPLFVGQREKLLWQVIWQVKDEEQVNYWLNCKGDKDTLGFKYGSRCTSLSTALSTKSGRQSTWSIFCILLEIFYHRRMTFLSSKPPRYPFDSNLIGNVPPNLQDTNWIRLWWLGPTTHSSWKVFYFVSYHLIVFSYHFSEYFSWLNSQIDYFYKEVYFASIHQLFSCVYQTTLSL